MLFSFVKQNVKAGDWINFVKSARNDPDQNFKDNYRNYLKNLYRKLQMTYYRKNLEDYNPGFSNR
ncbi:MAG: hypothetical protein WKG06_05065 [Segetibacter sp.]